MKRNAFHEYLGVPKGKPIPLGRAMAALRSAKRRGDERHRSEAQFAVNMIKRAGK